MDYKLFLISGYKKLIINRLTSGYRSALNQEGRQVESQSEQQLSLAELNQATLSAVLVTMYNKESVCFRGKITQIWGEGWITVDRKGDNGKQLGQEAWVELL